MATIRKTISNTFSYVPEHFFFHLWDHTGPQIPRDKELEKQNYSDDNGKTPLRLMAGTKLQKQTLLHILNPRGFKNGTVGSKTMPNLTYWADFA